MATAPITVGTFVLKRTTTLDEIDVLTRLAAAQRAGTRTCTTYLAGYMLVARLNGAPGLERVSALADTGTSIERVMLAAEPPTLNWVRLAADLVCATAALAALGLVHDDLREAAARNITMRDGRYYLIDFGVMCAAPANFDVGAFVDGTLAALAGWLVRQAPRYLERTALPSEFVDALDADTRRRYDRLRANANVKPAPPPPQRRIDLGGGGGGRKQQEPPTTARPPVLV